MPRLLAIDERRVSPAARGAYLASLAERRQRAAADGLRFWVFEHDDDPSRFIEFIEGDDRSAIARLREDAGPSALWREIQGG